MKKKKEFSKKLIMISGIISLLFVALSYILVLLGKDGNSDVTTTLIIYILSASLGYLLYNGSLKCSRNKYGVDEDGIPFKWKETIETDDEETDDVAADEEDNQ